MTTARAPLRIGFVGCGRVTQDLHLPALRRLPMAEVVAAADTDNDRLERVAGRYRIAKRYADAQALVADPAVDVVAVCTPPRYHAEIALGALEAGKHVFVEKPLAASLEECDRLVERAARAPQRAMVGFNLRWHRLLRRAREMVAAGALGTIELIRTAFTMRSPADVSEWRKHRETGGGVLAELAVHHFDLWRYLTGSEVEEVFAASRSGQWEDETAIVTARMASGPLACAVFSERTTDTHDIEIYGRDGSLRISCYRWDGFGLLPASSVPGSVATRLRRLAATLQELPRAALEARHGGCFRSTYQVQWRHFLDAILHDRPVHSTFQDGRCAQQVLLSATTSALRGQPVKVA